MRVGEGVGGHSAYNVYTKPLWADKSETIYRARESEAMKYVAEEAMKQAGLGSDSLSKQADAEEAKYRSQSKRGGPLEVDGGEGVRGSSPMERPVEVGRRESGRKIGVFV